MRATSALQMLTQLREFAIDPPGASLSFRARLARENGWTETEAGEVLDEYLHFIALTQFAGHEVTPSDSVDQAWHLHLTYTRNYWNQLCAELLGRPLHHGPTAGGPASDQRYRIQYGQTLRSYEQHFGYPPPARWWPAARERFAQSASARRIDTRVHWLIPRRWLPTAALTAAALLVAVLLPDLAEAQEVNPLNWTAGPFLKLYGSLILAAIAASLLVFFTTRGVDEARGARTLSPEQLAILAGRTSQLGDTVAVRLLERGALTLDTTTSKLVAATGVHGNDEFERAVLKRAATGAHQEELALALRDEAMRMEQELTRRGEMVRAEDWLRRVLLVTAPLALPWLLGLTKIVFGVMRDKPVGYLILGSIVLPLIALGFVISVGSVSARGRATLAYHRARHGRLKRAPTADELPLAVALFGTAVLSGTAYAHHADALRQATSSSGDGGGSSDGSSGGGSGGSGCGGCGGGD